MTKYFHELTGKEMERIFQEGCLKDRAIEYAIRMNAQEGLETSEDFKKMIDKVITGEMTFDDIRKFIEAKARAKSHSQGSFD